MLRGDAAGSAQPVKKVWARNIRGRCVKQLQRAGRKVSHLQVFYDPRPFLQRLATCTIDMDRTDKNENT